MFVVFEQIEDALGWDDVELMSFDTEIEAQSYVAELEASEVEEYGEVLNYYWYYEKA